jgi:glycosyltransferase involved in cell wall biosynthesis
LPVVAHDGDHFRWLLSDAALLRDLSVPGAAGEAIQHLCDDPNLGGRLRGAARARIEAKFSWEALLPSYIAMYSRMCKS